MKTVDELEALVATHACVMIVGPAGSGKTISWTLLRQALQQAHLGRDDCVTLTPEDVLTAYHVSTYSMTGMWLLQSAHQMK